MRELSQPSQTMPAGLSTMDFRSNDADRTMSSELTGALPDRCRGWSPRFSSRPPRVAAGASSHIMKLETLSVDFNDEQKRYLEGFAAGLQVLKSGRGLGGAPAKAGTEPSGPDAAHLRAQDMVVASGKKLADQEKV